MLPYTTPSKWLETLKWIATDQYHVFTLLRAYVRILTLMISTVPMSCDLQSAHFLYEDQHPLKRLKQLNLRPSNKRISRHKYYINKIFCFFHILNSFYHLI